LLLSWLGGCALLVRAGELSADPDGVLTLPQAQECAAAHAPTLRAARCETRAAEARCAHAAVRPNPVASVRAEDFGGSGAARGFRGAQYTAELEQSLDLAGHRENQVRVSRLDRTLADFDVDSARLDVAAETTRRFYLLLGAQERLALEQEALQLAEAFAQAVAARVQSGKVSPMDEEKARVLLAQQQDAVAGAHSSLRYARTHMAALWGSATARFDRAHGVLTNVPPPAEPAALAGRLPANPDVARWEYEREQRQAILVRERAACIPDVTISGGIRRSADTESQSFVIGLSIPLPFRDKNQGRIDEAVALVEKAEEEQKGATVALRAELTNAYGELTTARARIETLSREILPRSRTILEAVQKGYTEGRFTCLEVLDARRTYLEARADYLEALVTGHLAQARVERLAGKDPAVPRE
jgi:cobalt-zinc-cadmium efflux system outer membrane protein